MDLGFTEGLVQILALQLSTSVTLARLFNFSELSASCLETENSGTWLAGCWDRRSELLCMKTKVDHLTMLYALLYDFVFPASSRATQTWEYYSLSHMANMCLHRTYAVYLALTKSSHPQLGHSLLLQYPQVTMSSYHTSVTVATISQAGLT